MLHLGQETAAQPAIVQSADGTTVLTPADREELVKYIKDQLEIEQRQLDISERRSRRFWGAVIGLSTATTALITVLHFVYRNERASLARR